MKRKFNLKKALAALLVLTLVLTNMNSISAGMYNVDKYNNGVTDYETNFLSDLEDNKDLDYTRRGYLNVEYFQTSNFTHPGSVGPSDSNFWKSIYGKIVKDVDGTIIRFDGDEVINNWNYQSPTLNTYTISKGMLAGSIHTLRTQMKIQ